MSSSAAIRSASSSRSAIDLLAQPQPHIERYLLIAAAPGVDLVRQRAHALLQLADDQRVDVFVVGAVEECRLRDFARICSNASTSVRALRAVRMPTRSSARAKACEPRKSASSSRLSKWSEPEKRSKTSEGPLSNRPPQSFMRVSHLRRLASRATPAPESAARSG